MPKRKVAKPTITKQNAPSQGLLERLETEMQSNQSKVSLVLGALIILVMGILVFNYFNRNKAALGPAQQTNQEANQDVSPDGLPGKYTIKEGDTLFTIAEKYFKNGDKFTEIAKANNLTNVDQITAGQVLDIPKLESLQAQASIEPTIQPTTTAQPSESPSESPIVSPSPAASPEEVLGTGGGNTTIWGEKIEGNKYTVVEGDWLSTIAGRAYGDVMAFDKIAKANNISNPDHIEPGMVLNIPR